MISLSKKTMCIPTFMLSQHLLLKILSPPPSHPMKKKNKKTYLTGSLTFLFCSIFNFISYLVISFLRISKWYACITSCKKKGRTTELQSQQLPALPVMAILADHLDVPSKTLCFTAFMWPVWDFLSTPNTFLISKVIRRSLNY